MSAVPTPGYQKCASCGHLRPRHTQLWNAAHPPSRTSCDVVFRGGNPCDCTRFEEVRE